MDAAAAQREAQALGVLPQDSGLVWSVDGMISSETRVKRIPHDSIATVEIAKFENRPHIYVTTKAAQRIGFAQAPDTTRVINTLANGDVATVNIRPMRMVTAEGAPLLYIDGVRADMAALKALDRTHIDKVEVIKGPYAVSRYGADAIAGVIVVTTKH